MVVCIHLPRFELVVAAGGPEALSGRALAVAPQMGSEQRLGEVSGAAEARGVARGMLLGEALARCPALHLVSADPVRVSETWETAMRALESIGAAVEQAGHGGHTARPSPSDCVPAGSVGTTGSRSSGSGLAYFEADGLRGLHGSDQATIAAAQRALGRPARVGAGPTRFYALAAALAVRSRRPLVLDGKDARRWLAGRPVELLGFRAETEALVEPLRRLGVRTLGEMARLGRPELADRFGEAGVFAQRLLCGEEEPLRPRAVEPSLKETLHLGDASSGEALERVLGVLVDRLLARGERRGRTLRVLLLSARLLAGGAWRERVVFRQALSDPERIRLALRVRLALLPAPAAELGLTVERFGAPAGEQGALFDRDPAHSAARAARLREAVAQLRAVAGPDAALRAVCVDPDSRVPERRVVLAPFL